AEARARESQQISEAEDGAARSLPANRFGDSPEQVEDPALPHLELRRLFERGRERSGAREVARPGDVVAELEERQLGVVQALGAPNVEEAVQERSSFGGYAELTSRELEGELGCGFGDVAARALGTGARDLLEAGPERPRNREVIGGRE